MSRTPYRLRSVEHKRAANARWLAGRHHRLGKLEPSPCESCGCEKAEKHHDDYSRPLDVRWLCRRCHMRLHSWERDAEFAAIIGRTTLEVVETFARNEDEARSRRIHRIERRAMA